MWQMACCLAVFPENCLLTLGSWWTDDDARIYSVISTENTSIQLKLRFNLVLSCHGGAHMWLHHCNYTLAHWTPQSWEPFLHKGACDLTRKSWEGKIHGGMFSRLFVSLWKLIRTRLIHPPLERFYSRVGVYISGKFGAKNDITTVKTAITI